MLNLNFKQVSPKRWESEVDKSYFVTQSVDNNKFCANLPVGVQWVNSLELAQWICVINFNSKVERQVKPLVWKSQGDDFIADSFGKKLKICPYPDDTSYFAIYVGKELVRNSANYVHLCSFVEAQDYCYQLHKERALPYINIL